MSRTVRVEITFISEWKETIEVEVPDGADVEETDVEVVIQTAVHGHNHNALEADRNAEVIDWMVV